MCVFSIIKGVWPNCDPEPQLGQFMEVILSLLLTNMVDVLRMYSTNCLRQVSAPGSRQEREREETRSCGHSHAQGQSPQMSMSAAISFTKESISAYAFSKIQGLSADPRRTWPPDAPEAFVWLPREKTLRPTIICGISNPFGQQLLTDYLRLDPTNHLHGLHDIFHSVSGTHNPLDPRFSILLVLQLPGAPMYFP